jgi:hypothetical protein
MPKKGGKKRSFRFWDDKYLQLHVADVVFQRSTAEELGVGKKTVFREKGGKVLNVEAAREKAISDALAGNFAHNPVARHTSHVTRHTSHVTRHTSHVTPPTPTFQLSATLF